MRALLGTSLLVVAVLLPVLRAQAVVVGPGSASVADQLMQAIQPDSFLPPADNLSLILQGISPTDLPSILVQPIPTVVTDLPPISPAAADGLGVAGATGGLTHPACVAETARRAAMDPPQPPPNGDFPCVVPASNNSGIVEGVCFVTVCRGVASTGLDGLMSALSGNLSSLTSIVSSLLGNLLQPKPSSPSDGAPDSALPTNPTVPQSTSPLITDALLTPQDMSKLFNDSGIIVRDLLFSLNAPTPAVAQ